MDGIKYKRLNIFFSFLSYYVILLFLVNDGLHAHLSFLYSGGFYSIFELFQVYSFQSHSCVVSFMQSYSDAIECFILTPFNL